MIALLRQIPNLLTVLRLASAPITAFLLFDGAYVAALAVFVFAGLTDAADGFLAKRYGLDTRVGAWLDPAADKLLMLASFLALTYVGATPPWLTVLVLARDAAIVVAVLFAKSMGWPLRVQPQLLGKISTAIQVGYVGLMLLMLAFEIGWPRLSYVAAVVTAVFTLASWLSYGQVFLRAIAIRHSRPA
ncbi:MAG TPA: CDP-alcohol phosphatidyltransferase family protein [Rhizomicrobium sp.]|nr:CDP-alcohol phosphatidyltransferase family protein [Rhizomicrobium sp.]